MFRIGELQHNPETRRLLGRREMWFNLFHGPDAHSFAEEMMKKIVGLGLLLLVSTPALGDLLVDRLQKNAGVTFDVLS